MSNQILLVAVLGGITLLAYMIAINAHGPTRLGISYLLATIMLAGTVWVIVQYVNTGIDSMKVDELKRLEMEKQKAEERIRTQEETILENMARLEFAGKLNTIITKGTGLATTMMNVDLQDLPTLEELQGRAVATGKNVTELQDEFKALHSPPGLFVNSMSTVGDAIQLLNDAAYYYRRFYVSDPGQDELRERIMRQKSREAYQKFEAASSLVASGN